MGEGSEVALSAKMAARSMFSGTASCATLSVVVAVVNDDEIMAGVSSVDGEDEEIGLAKVVQAPNTRSKVIVTVTQLRGIEVPFRRDRLCSFFHAS